jgi:hypothetical protein
LPTRIKGSGKSQFQKPTFPLETIFSEQNFMHFMKEIMQEVVNSTFRALISKLQEALASFPLTKVLSSQVLIPQIPLESYLTTILVKMA